MTESRSRGLHAPVLSLAAAARVLALGIVGLATVFILDAFLTLGRGLPGGVSPFRGDATFAGWVQFALYPAVLVAILVHVLRAPHGSLVPDARRLSHLAAYVIRAAFWAVLIVGVVDIVISFLRVEEMLSLWFTDDTVKRIGIPSWRGSNIHVPLIILGIAIGTFSRAPGFTWLAFLVVTAEFGIVLARFIFSYEQTFMGDLVRFWYAALFLFASAETLVQDGHVRVDVLYAEFSPRRKAWANCLGSLILGFPLCISVLVLGLADKASIIASPILSFETTQSGFGLYVKYMMAGFLGIFAYSMLVQFAAYFLNSAATLLGETDASPPVEAESGPMADPLASG